MKTEYPYCIRGHTAQAIKKGATPQEIMEAIAVISSVPSW